LFFQTWLLCSFCYWLNAACTNSSANRQVPARARNDALIKLRAFLEANLAGVEAHLRAASDDGDEGDDIALALRSLLAKEPASALDRV
jgi:hypothetical protein